MRWQKAKEAAYEKLYTELEDDGPSKIYKLAKTRQRRSKDIDHLKFVKDEDGKIFGEDDAIKERWRGYFKTLLNTQNCRDTLPTASPIQGPIEDITEEEVRVQLDKMASNKARGPDDIPIEVVKMMKDAGVSWMTSCLREIMRNGIPHEWRKSKITPIFKQKGDPLSCGNYRGIKLLCHSLKL